MARRLALFPIAWFVGLLLIDYCFAAVEALLPKPSFADFVFTFVELGLGVAWGAACYCIAEFGLTPAPPRVRGILWPLGFLAGVVLVFAGPVATEGSANTH